MAKKTGAPGHVAVENVAKWLARQKYGSLGYFEVVDGEVDDVRAEALGANARRFLRLPDGSEVVLVSRDAASSLWGVGYLGSEGETDTLAQSLEEFLIGWSRGEAGVGELDDEDATGRSKLGAWLEKHWVTAPSGGTPFDFDMALEGGEARLDGPPPAVSSAVVPGLGPTLHRLTTLVGRRADDPDLVRFVTDDLGKKVPATTTGMSDSKDVSAPKRGLELVFTHDVLRDDYPPIAKTKNSFVPYLSLVFLEPKLREPLPFGTRFGMTDDEVAALDGTEGWLTTGASRYRYLDRSRGIVYSVVADGESQHSIGVEDARALSAHGVPNRWIVGIFLSWAIARDLLDGARFPRHADLIAKIRAREARGSELVDAALPRGLWDDHLKGDFELRSYAFGYFHNIGGQWITADFKKIFGKRKGPHGHDEPKLDDDGALRVDAASPVLDDRFAQWIG